MFMKNTLISLSTLAVFAVANPDGISIPVVARRGFTNADSSFDLKAATRYTQEAANRHRGNLLALQNNEGEEALNPVSSCVGIKLPFLDQ